MIIIRVSKPAGFRFNWRGGSFRIPIRLLLQDKKELKRFEKYAKSNNIEFEVIKGLEEPKEEQQVVEEQAATNEQPTEEQVQEEQPAEEEKKEVKLDKSKLSQMKKSELIELAKEAGIEDAQNLKKDELIELLADQ